MATHFNEIDDATLRNVRRLMGVNDDSESPEVDDAIRQVWSVGYRRPDNIALMAKRQLGFDRQEK